MKNQSPEKNSYTYLNLEIGLSYGAAIKEFQYIQECLDLDVKILEIPYSDPVTMEQIRQFCLKNNIKMSIHYPSHYSVGFLDFEITGPTIEGIEKNLYRIQMILESYQDSEYLVIHFPTLFPKSNTNEQNQDLLIEVLTKLSVLQRRYPTTIVIENVTVNPMGYQPEWYKSLLDGFDNLGFCLDIGHAHILEDSSVNQFFDCLKHKIEVVHLYNTPKKSYSHFRKGIHYPFHSIQNSKGGWMDYLDIVKQINHLPNVRYVIHEYDRNSVQDVTMS